MWSPILRSILILGNRGRAKYLTLLLLRLFTNVLDLVAVAFTGFLGAALASDLSGEAGARFLGIEIPDSSGGFMATLGGAVVVFFVAKFLLAATIVRLSTAFLATVEAEASSEIAGYLFTGPLSRMRGQSQGDILWATNQSTQVAITGLLSAAASIATEAALLLGMFVLFVWVDLQVAIYVSLYFFAVFAVFHFGISGKIKSTGQAVATSAIDVADSVENLTRAFREIRVAGAGESFLEQFRTHRKDLARAGALHTFLLALPRYFVEVALIIGVVLLVLWQATASTLADGFATVAVFLAGGAKMMAALLPLQSSIANARFFAPQATKAHDLLRRSRIEDCRFPDLIPLDETELAGIDAGGGLQVELRDVSFTHPNHSASTISDLTMTVPAGSIVALVGPSGSGKTTIADLLLGINLPELGEVTLGGLTPERLNRFKPGVISYVPQVPGLVSGSIAQNVAIGVPAHEIDAELVTQCLAMAQLSEFTDALPQGIFSDLGRRADALSGGQRQRLGLARALYSRPKLVVLDEATSALDATTEAGVAQTLRSLGIETTVIVIAHRLSTIQDVDKIFVIQDGRISAEGSFEEVRIKVPLVAEYVKLLSFDSNG